MTPSRRTHRQASTTAHVAQNDTLDLAKAILAVMITAIHLLILSPWQLRVLIPPLRVAVPLFFMISAYLFFAKQRLLPAAARWPALKAFVARNYKLYAFWFLVLFIPTLNARHYFDRGFWPGVAQIIGGMTLGSTFTASWFLSALALGTAVVWGLSRVMRQRWVLLLTLAAYLYCVLLTNYGGLTWVQTLVPHIPYRAPIFFAAPNSILAGLFWIALGKFFADHRGTCYTGRWQSQLGLVAVGYVLLALEQLLIVWRNSSVAADCYASLVILVPLLFGLILHIPLHLPHARFLRAFSTVTYCLHATLRRSIVAHTLSAGVVLNTFKRSILLWLLILLMSATLTAVILRLQQRRGWGWLRYAH